MGIQVRGVLARRKWARPKAVNFDAPVGSCHFECFDKPDEDRVVRPEPAIGENQLPLASESREIAASERKSGAAVVAKQTSTIVKLSSR